MLLRGVLYACTAVGAYYLVSFLQAYLHLAIGHRARGWSLYRIHVGSHHAIYAGHHQVSDRYSAQEQSITFSYSAPVAAVQCIALILLPRDLFFVEFASCAAAALVHIYVHVHCHLARSWLDRLAWFRRLRAYHSIHHQNTSANFAVIEPLWDRLFGTYCAPALDA